MLDLDAAEIGPDVHDAVRVVVDPYRDVVPGAEFDVGAVVVEVDDDAVEVAFVAFRQDDDVAVAAFGRNHSHAHCVVDVVLKLVGSVGRSGHEAHGLTRLSDVALSPQGQSLAELVFERFVIDGSVGAAREDVDGRSGHDKVLQSGSRPVGAENGLFTNVNSIIITYFALKSNLLRLLCPICLRLMSNKKTAY